MTEQTDPIEADVNANADGSSATEVGKEDWEARAKRAEAEAAKYRAQRKQAQQERDELKAKTKTQDEDYKSLWQQEREEKEQLLDSVKGAAVTSALTAQLTKAGIRPEAIEAAIKLADKKLVEWDRADGVDASSVVAAVQKLKATEGWMFESKVAKTEPKTPADGSATNANEIKRSDFDKLPAAQRSAVIEKGVRITD